MSLNLLKKGNVTNPIINFVDDLVVGLEFTELLLVVVGRLDVGQDH